MDGEFKWFVLLCVTLMVIALGGFFVWRDIELARMRHHCECSALDHKAGVD